MYGHRLVDVRRNQIIISRKSTRCSSSRSDRWLFQKTLYRSNVLQFICFVKRSPNGFISSNMSYSHSSRAAYHSFRTMGLRQLASFAATWKQNACTKKTTARTSRMLAASNDGKSCTENPLPDETAHVYTYVEPHSAELHIRACTTLSLTQPNDVPSTEA